MNTPKVILCERGQKWALALAQHLPAPSILRQTRGWKQARDELNGAPASLLVLELTPENRSSVLALLDDLSDRFPLARSAILAEADMKDHEWLVREAGATFFSTSVRDCQQLARLAQRHLRGCISPPGDLVAQIWDSLPWSDSR